MTSTEIGDAARPGSQDLAEADCVFEAIVDPVLVIDRDDRIVRANRAACRVFGYEASGLLDQHISLLIPNSHETTSYRFVHAYLARKADGDNGFRFSAVSAEGKPIPIHLTLTKAKIDRETRFVATIHDLRSVERNERELMHYIEELESARLQEGEQSERVVQLAEELSSEKRKLRANEIQLEQNEVELQRYIQDLEMTRAQFEKQADEMAGLAEELHAEKERVEESRRVIEYQAHHDPLTRLGNRALLSKVLPAMIEEAQARGTKVGLIYLDLDNFKPVNDRLGHEAGDTLLKTVADTLRRCIRAEDEVVRQGGDEFAIAVRLDAHRTEHELREMAERVRTALRLAVEGPDFTIETGASIGIALYPDDGSDIDTMLMAADAAMYRAKRAGKGRVS